jgi:hypothetical protein
LPPLRSNKSSDDGKGANDLRVFSLSKAWDDIYTNNQPTIGDLDELARGFNILTGKWLVFAQSADVDSLRSRIARATHAGTLGTSAKVSPRSDESDSDRHVICVFTCDYTDHQEKTRLISRPTEDWYVG